MRCTFSPAPSSQQSCSSSAENCEMRQMFKNYSAQLKLCLAFLVLFCVTFLTGTFCDKTVAEALFSPNITFVKIITTTGVYPFYAIPVLFSGALFERVLHSERTKKSKILLCIICCYIMLYNGLIGIIALTSRNNLGSIFPSVTGNVPVIILLCIILEYPLFFVGYLCAEKNKDKLLSQRVIALFVIMVSAFVSMQLLKNFFDRPRYRTVVLGYDGVPFMPWYKPFTGADGFAAKYGLNIDEFRSFPSGHSIFSSITMCLFPSLTWLFPKLKDKYTHLCFAGAAFAITIMLSRMILGAHYLSDTSAGAIIGTLCSAAFAAVQMRISHKSSTSSK